MAKFRRRTVEVEAVKVRDLVNYAKNDWYNMPQWVRDEYEKGNIMFWNTGILFKDSRGEMRVHFDDWLVKGENGYIYSWRSENFDEAYEPAE